MTINELLVMQFKTAMDVIDMVLKDVSHDELHFNPGGTANPAATNYAHVIVGMDQVINGMLQSKPALADTKYKDSTGLSSPYPDMKDADKTSEWMKTAKVDMEKFAVYAKEVTAMVEDYIKNASAEELDKEIEIPGLGKQKHVWVISIFVIWNIAAHSGEIAVAKGVQGLKGYPF